MINLGKDLARQFFSFFSWGYYFSARRLSCKNKKSIFLMRIVVPI